MKQKGSRRISFEQFVTALAAVAEAKQATLEAVVKKVSSAAHTWGMPQWPAAEVVHTLGKPQRCGTAPLLRVVHIVAARRHAAAPRTAGWRRLKPTAG